MTGGPGKQRPAIDPVRQPYRHFQEGSSLLLSKVPDVLAAVSSQQSAETVAWEIIPKPSYPTIAEQDVASDGTFMSA